MPGLVLLVKEVTRRDVLSSWNPFFSPALAVPGGHTPLELIKRSRGDRIAAASVKTTRERMEKRMFWVFMVSGSNVAVGETVRYGPAEVVWKGWSKL